MTVSLEYSWAKTTAHLCTFACIHSWYTRFRWTVEAVTQYWFTRSYSRMDWSMRSLWYEIKNNALNFFSLSHRVFWKVYSYGEHCYCTKAILYHENICNSPVFVQILCSLSEGGMIVYEKRHTPHFPPPRPLQCSQMHVVETLEWKVSYISVFSFSKVVPCATRHLGEKVALHVCICTHMRYMCANHNETLNTEFGRDNDKDDDVSADNDYVISISLTPY